MLLLLRLVCFAREDACGLLLSVYLSLSFLLWFLFFFRVLVLQKKLLRDDYPTLSAFISDVRLVCLNCVSFNESSSAVYDQALELSEMFEEEVHTHFHNITTVQADDNHDGFNAQDENDDADDGNDNGFVVFLSDCLGFVVYSLSYLFRCFSISDLFCVRMCVM